jgi:metal-responsive CopG/Arc/MetJ family transcriptional regulator
MVFGVKVKIDKALYERVKAVADKAGYSSADEFITNVLEKELAKLEDAETDEQLEERLRGLGYIE